MNSKVLFLMVLLISQTNLSAIFAQNVICSSGEILQNQNNIISSTLGEIIIETFSAGEYILTQGFQQSNLRVTAIKKENALNLSIRVSPNPVRDYISLKIDSDCKKNINYKILDLNGKCLQHKQVLQSEMQISFINFSSSTYFIIVYNGKIELQTFKVIKQ